MLRSRLLPSLFHAISSMGLHVPRSHVWSRTPRDRLSTQRVSPVGAMPIPTHPIRHPGHANLECLVDAVRAS